MPILILIIIIIINRIIIHITPFGYMSAPHSAPSLDTHSRARTVYMPSYGIPIILCILIILA